MPNPYPSQPFRALTRPALLVMSVRDAVTANAIHTAPVSDISTRREHELSDVPHLPARLSDGGNGCDGAVRYIRTFVETNHEGSQSCDALNGQTGERPLTGQNLEMSYSLSPNTTVIQSSTERINFTKELLEMANLRHPVDIGLEDLAFLRNGIEQEFIADDGVVDAGERGMLIQFDQAVATMTRARNLEKALELAVKQQGVVTRYTQQQFAEAGLAIEPLGAA